MHSKLLQQQIDLTNNVNLSYVGPVYFGTPLQMSSDSEFVYDTGSGYLTTTSTECSLCLFSKYYDPSASSTSSEASSTTK